MRKLIAPLALCAAIILAAMPAAAAPPYSPTPTDQARAWGDFYAKQAAFIAALPALNGDGGALAHVTNWPGSFSLTGSLPAFAATPTFNLGTLNGAALDASISTTNTDVGAPGATACATDNGACSLNALLERNNQRITSLIAALGSPFQAGGSIGNTSFTANIGTTNGLALDTSVGTTNTDLGAPGATACTTDNGSCSLNALIERTNQRITSLIAALGSPFQAGGSIGNTGFTANAGTNLNTSALALDASVGTTNADVGPPGATACATDNGSCSLNALLERNNQRITSLISALGSPFQAGASIGNTSFTANAGTNLNTSALALDASVGTTNTDLGAPGATACTTDNGSCSLNALLERNNQRITSLISALASPFQAGGSIGNASFGISGSLPAFASTPAVNAQPTPVTSGGLLIATAVAANTTNSTLVKNAAGQVYEIRVFNNSGTIAYLKTYNKASAPTCGTDTPVDHFLVPGLTGGSGLIFTSAMGDAYGTGIGYCLTGGIADNDTTAVAASAYLVTVGYK